MADGVLDVENQVSDEKAKMSDELVTQSANIFLMARRALLASLGVVALSLEEGNQFIEKLVERGEVAESDVYKMLNDLRVEGQSQEEEASASRKSMVEKASLALEDSVDQILGRFNVPTRNDIEELSNKITQLTERLQHLKKQNGG